MDGALGTRRIHHRPAAKPCELPRSGEFAVTLGPLATLLPAARDWQEPP